MSSRKTIAAVRTSAKYQSTEQVMGWRAGSAKSGSTNYNSNPLSKIYTG